MSGLSAPRPAPRTSATRRLVEQVRERACGPGWRSLARRHSVGGVRAPLSSSVRATAAASRRDASSVFPGERQRAPQNPARRMDAPCLREDRRASRFRARSRPGAFRGAPRESQRLGAAASGAPAKSCITMPMRGVAGDRRAEPQFAPGPSSPTARGPNPRRRPRTARPYPASTKSISRRRSAAAGNDGLIAGHAAEEAGRITEPPVCVPAPAGTCRPRPRRPSPTTSRPACAPGCAG